MPDDQQTILVRAQLRDLHGESFQSCFSSLMEHRHGSDFKRIRPYGALGDQGCDGYHFSTEEVFACYGPLGGRASVREQCDKIRTDFEKAKPKAAEERLEMARWTFVHNLVDGLSTDAVKELKRLERENPGISIRTFGLPEFVEIWPHDALHAPRLQRPAPEQPQAPQDDREWMDPKYAHIPLIGREKMLEDLRTWLEGSGVSVRVLTAAGGSGKTRLAWDLCREAEKKGWDAGFLKQDALKQLLSHPDPSAWCWYQPTLLVFDYAAFAAGDLRTWFLRLTESGNNKFALRILLLERHGEPGEGWWDLLFNAPGSDGDNRAVQGLLNPPAPVPFPKEMPLLWRRNILTAVLKARGAGISLPDDPLFNKQLETLSWGSQPLFLIMAALLSEQRKLSILLAFSRTELVMEMAQRELTRVRGFADGKPRQQILCRLAACATLAGGLTRENAMALADEEKRANGYPNAGDPGEFADWLHNALPGPDDSVAPILPDMLGEAVLLSLFQKKDDSTVARVFDLAPEKTAEALVRCVQDYSDPAHPEQHQQPVQWLSRLIHRPELTLEHAIAIADSMPITTIALKELAVAVRQGIVNRLKAEVQQGQRAMPDSLLAYHLNNLGVELADLGRRQEALLATEEAVGFYRPLAEHHPDAYRPYLASSLNNLGNRLADLGRHQEALLATEEAVELYRSLAEHHPDAYRPNLAASLNNLGNMLTNLGRRQEALSATEEAIGLYRSLAERHPGAYRPNLAASLNNLGTMLDTLGRYQEALSATEEAVEFYRSLAEGHPDAYRPDLAMSLNNLGNRLASLGRHQEALSATEEAVGLYRSLAERHPDVYRPNLAGSLNGLGIRLAALGRHQEALSATEEAVRIRRSLAERHPDAYKPWLATSLNALSNRFHALEQHTEAHAFVMEAVEMLSPYYLALPEAYTRWMAIMVNNYKNRCQYAGIEPDQALLAPILEKM